MTADPDLTIIDDLGVTAVAKALDISREAVRQWRLRGTIPDHRRAELRRLMTNDIGSDGRPGWPSLPTRLPMVIDQRSADHCDSLIDLATIAGPDAKSKVEAAIAGRTYRVALESSMKRAGLPGLADQSTAARSSPIVPTVYPG
jgi:hypothetical protein